MVSLAVDVGNTNAKFAVFNGGALVTLESVVTNKAVGRLQKLIRAHAPMHAILSNVGTPLKTVQEMLQTKTKLVLLTPSTPVPITVMYKSKTLGTDRLALAVLSHSLFPNNNVLTVSAGTCITYDVVTKARYPGGVISPGLQMRLNAMHDYTQRLPKVKLVTKAPPVGDTTHAAMLSGAVFGAAHEVNGFIAQYKQRYGNLKIVLTGGDAARLEPHLKFKIFARPYAVLEGLQRILQHNLGAL